jgi:hypothetical protein
MKLDNFDKLDFTIKQIKKIKKVIPPEQEVAMLLYLYEITVEEFINMRRHLNISDPMYIKITNYLTDEWRNKK